MSTFSESPRAVSIREFFSSRRSILAEQKYILHIVLFLLTIFCSTWAGTFWTGHPARTSSATAFLHDLSFGLPYSFGLLTFLTVHEFGHFIAAFIHRIRTTLPFYIPLPPLPFLLSIGTMGAVIRIKDRIVNTDALLDTGAAGPISGFIISLGLLLYGFMHLPPADYIFVIHPEYLAAGGIPPPAEGNLYLGKNLLFIILETLLKPRNLPPMTEMYHYPYLFTGWLGSFVTALNLLPVGQLDGGHVTYALFGRRGHLMAARTFLGCITILGLPSFILGVVKLLLPDFGSPLPDWILHYSWPGWIIWAIVLAWFIGIKHPPTGYDHPLSQGRTAVGWIAVIIFFLTFTPVPFGLI